MSGSYSMKGTPAGGTGVKKGSLTSNGNGPPPLSYPADPPDDENMNEIIDENVDLTVVLPDGSQQHRTIEPNIPMMDLLIQLAAVNKLNPAGHTLVVLTGDKWKQIDFKANKTIGLLAGEDRQVSVQIVKKKVEDKVKVKTATQPFEMTYRFTVNLPGNQKKVLRISPKLSLSEIRQQLCKEKNFDQSRYVFLLPGNPKETLDDSTTVGDLKTSEINFTSIAMIEAASSKSMPDLALAATRATSDTREKKDDSGYMPSAGEKKAKKGFLSFLGKKDKKFKVQQDADVEVKSRPKKSESFNVGATKQTENARPVTMFADSGELDHFNMRRTTGNLHQFSDKSEFRKSTGSGLVPLNENVVLATKSDDLQESSRASASQNNRLRESTSGAPPKKSAKKRAAPLPPQMNKTQQPKTVQVEIDVHSQSSEQTRIEDIPNERVHLKKNHSRNSSDSSGYHELTVSGAESPDANKGDNLQITHDTTSIDSVDQFNGDSGIRVSPVNRRSASKVAASSRDSSTDIDKPLAPGRKKKRAPLPPPGMTVNSVETSGSNRPPSPKQETLDSKRQQAEEFEALQAMEEVTMKFNIEDSDDDMRMVETSSVHSEDIDIDAPHRQQPPTFIAPPPPSEPPPDDTEPVDLNMVVNKVDTIDIGVGEDTTSLGPDSVKSSPITISSRRHSISSNSSVNTIEDLSLAFRQTIEVGEEALGLESDNDSVQEELTRAMPEFKEQISKLAAEDNEEMSARSKDSEKAVDSDDSFIVHDDENEKDNEKEKDNYQASLRLVEGNRESSEITYDFRVESVPADFRNLEKEDDDKESSDDSFIVEEVEILPAKPGILEMGSPRKIPDLDSPKEHKVMSLPVHDLHAEMPLEESTPKPSAGNKNQREEGTIPDKPKEKEEFVISFDELSNVDFSAPDPNEQKKAKRKSTEAPKVNYRIAFRSSRDFDEEDVVVEAVPAKVVENEPVFNDTEDSDEGVKTKCSELSFSPENEHEDEHLMEEKSISMIALPAERTPVKNSQVMDDGATGDSYTSSTQITLSQASSPSPSSNMDETSPRKDDSFDSSSLMQVQYNQLQQQFTMWQNQLLQNQKLLATQGSPDFSSANQMSGKDDQSNLQLQQLQIQIQMQQQMMMQLQQNMHALAMQNTLASQQQTFPQPVNQPTVAMETVQTQKTPPPSSTQILTTEKENNRSESPIRDSSGTQGQTYIPPPPPAAPAVSVVSSKPKPSKADAKYTKPKQRRIERQLDPREQLMLDIRSFGKRDLKKVPVKATHWHK